MIGGFPVILLQCTAPTVFMTTTVQVEKMTRRKTVFYLLLSYLTPIIVVSALLMGPVIILLTR